MKRSLPSYEDLIFEEEDGEILEDSFPEDAFVDESDEEDLGLKAVLPVGKYGHSFREGDEPLSGEQYLCTVRSQRLKLKRIFVHEREINASRIDLGELCKKYSGNAEMITLALDRIWAEKYWKCYRDSEQSFLSQLDSCPEDEEEKGQDSKMNLNRTAAEWFTALYLTSDLQPTVAVLKELQNNQHIIEKLINLHRKWLDSSGDDPKIADNDTDNLDHAATWLQALLMCLDSRLTSPEIASLRLLAASLIKSFPDSRKFNEIVLVIGKKYGQTDLIKFT